MLRLKFQYPCQGEGCFLMFLAADQLLPAMKSAAKTLENIPRLYEDLDGFFWRNFSDLFTGSNEPLPRDRAWATLFRLRDTAEPGNLTDPLLRLTRNNDRITAACAALNVVLKR